MRRVIRLCWVSRMEHGPQAQISLLYPIARGNCPLTIPTSYDFAAVTPNLNVKRSARPGRPTRSQMSHRILARLGSCRPASASRWASGAAVRTISLKCLADEPGLVRH